MMVMVVQFLLWIFEYLEAEEVEDCCIVQPNLQLAMEQLVVVVVVQLVPWLLLWAFEYFQTEVVEDCEIEPLALQMIILVLLVVVVGVVEVEVVAIQQVVVP